MIKINLPYIDISDLNICFITVGNNATEFYATSDCMLETAICEYEAGNVLSMNLVFMNMN